MTLKRWCNALSSRGFLCFGCLFLCILLCSYVHAETCSVDDTKARVCLPHPAQRIITLSPGAAELVYSVGAGGQMVASVDYTDYPEAARHLPSVGGSSALDLERLLQYRPDLVIAWQSGNSPQQIRQLKQLGVPVFTLEPHGLGDVSASLERLGVLTGHTSEGQDKASRFSDGIAQLRQHYAKLSPVRTFYEVWNQPLMTINHQQIINQVIELCGGRNIYAALTPLVPRMSKEAVLADNPDAIVSGGEGEHNDSWLNDWKQYPQLSATAHHNLIFIPPDLMDRPTLRLLQGAQMLCQKLDAARHRLAGNP